MPLSMEEFDWPFFALKNDIPRELTRQGNGLDRFALATLVARTGSAPQPVGCQMLVGEDGQLAGYVSGGCVESNLAIMAKEVIAEGKGRFVAFGKDSEFIDVHLPCGTRIELALEAFRRSEPAVESIVQNAESRTPALFASDVEMGERLCVPLDEIEGRDGHLLRTIFQGQSIDELPEAGQIGQIYWKKYVPTPRLVINGGDPVAVALAQMARVSGLEVVVNRRDGPEASQFDSEIAYHRKDGTDLFGAVPADPYTAVVTTTHDLAHDHDILARALPSPAFYVGVLGSRSHLPERRARLEEAGVTDDEYARLAAPVGLDIGAVSPNEIAAAIVGDVIRAWHGR